MEPQSPADGSARPRVAMFINALTRGGGETQFLRVAAALHRGGYAVRVFTLQPGDDFAGSHDETPVTLLAPRVGPATMVNAVRALRDWRPDVTISFLYQGALAGRLASLVSRVPVVVSSMRNERLETPMKTRIYRLTGVIDAVTVTNSEIAAATLRREGTVAAAKLRVIPNGVDLELLEASTGSADGVRAELGLAPGDLLFLGVGRLREQKDWPTLFEAITRYDGPRAFWAIAGDGPEHDALEARIEQLGIGDRVRLLGLRDDIPTLMAACDALVLSSIYEGLPNVVLEAMACARPVIATRVGGCEELIGGGLGVLVEPRDPAGLATAMTDLARLDPGEREAMGKAARDHVRSRYALDVAGRQWVELVDELRRTSPRLRRRAMS